MDISNRTAIASTLSNRESLTATSMMPLSMAISEHSLIQDVPGFIEELRTSYQPVSRASHLAEQEKKQGEKDARNKWPETSKCIEIIRPQAIQLENVAGLVTNGYINTVFSDLARLRYDFRYDVLPAAAYGADHLRKRLWVIAYASGVGLETAGCYFRNGSKVRCKWPGSASPPKIDAIDRVNRHPEPPFLRKYDGVASWMDRIKAIGNGQHPGVAAGAWTDLTESI